VIVHGGARSIPPDERAAFAQGCLTAVQAAASILADRGTALDAAEAAVRLLEDMPHYNAGRGSVRNADGDIEMDAAIMDGETLALGAVGAIRDVRHPVSVARAMLHEIPTLLVGDGAARFAKRVQAEPAIAVQQILQVVKDRGCDTVGCVARDSQGHLAAAGSTGGLAGKLAGRVGDTPLPGCGLYADDELGAAAFSGDGESIARGMLAGRALRALPNGSSTDAARHAIETLRRIGGEAGAIVIDPEGRIGIAHSSEQFSLGIAASWINSPQAATHANDLKEWLQ
jgi:beta-aspartyl-peptidase (threonine type)